MSARAVSIPSQEPRTIFCKKIEGHKAIVKNEVIADNYFLLSLRPEVHV